MKVTSILITSALLAGCFVSTARTADEEPSKDELENMTKRAEALSQITTAAQLTAYGRGELVETPQLKGIKNPDALVVAGGILLRVHNLTEGKMGVLDVEVKDDKGAVIKEGPKPKSLADQAEDLFKEAEGIVLVNKGDKKALDALIAKAKADAVVKGAIGGPKSMYRIIASGGVFHNFDIRFQSACPASITINSDHPIQLEVIGVRGKELTYSAPSRFHTFNWRTGKGAQFGFVKVKVINAGDRPATYTLTTN